MTLMANRNMLVEPLHITSESVLNPICSKLCGLGRGIIPSLAVILPSLSKRKKFVINIIIYFRKLARINLAPNISDRLTKTVILDYLSNPMRDKPVMDFHLKCIVGFLTVIA